MTRYKNNNKVKTAFFIFDYCYICIYHQGNEFLNTIYSVLHFIRRKFYACSNFK